jgi:hypothetical protein
MIHTVQLALADAGYAARLREALTHSGPWHIVAFERPDPAQSGVLVLDESGFERLPLPLPHPERVVLVTRMDQELLSAAWEAGVVSVVSVDDPVDTVLLAIMAASLRVPKSQVAAVGGISRNVPRPDGPITPESHPPAHKRPRNV